ncbi:MULTISPECIES: helix-turn-helix domain-containing protein [Thermogemmatispora]|uniref:helix-turn-helix domain-containing protein n=1 Tax=Thermogemmatispora TaxID=768669 RepID=UPI0006995DAD|nr:MULTISPECIES: helix-turn-helix domain-containing protein [Thermogemmatispora]
MARRESAVVDHERDSREEHTTELLTVSEVAKRLRVDDTTVRRWIKTGALQAITLPHKGKREVYRVKKNTLDELLNTPATAAS